MTYEIVVGFDCPNRMVEYEIRDIKEKLSGYITYSMYFRFHTKHCKVQFLSKYDISRWKGLRPDCVFNPPARFVYGSRTFVHDSYSSQKLMNLIVRIEKNIKMETKSYNDIIDAMNYSYSTYTDKDVASIYPAFSHKTLKPRISKVIFNEPATIVFWKDGTKTVVKAHDGEVFDKEKGLAMAISKKLLGTNKSGSNYYDEFKKWIPEHD